MTKYLIGIDIGTQSSKVSIFDQCGHEICSATERFKPLIYPKPGYVEHPDDVLWDSLKIASRSVMRMFKDLNLPSDAIAGVGLCVVRSCRTLMKADGSLANPVINWMDTRISTPYTHDILDTKFISATTGYISWRLTGAFRDTSAYYDMYGQWPLDQKTFNWSTDPKVLERYNLPLEMLPELVQPGDVLGYVTADASAQTGLPEGLAVVATANDKAVEALGSGIYKDETLLISLGTYITSMLPATKWRDPHPNYWTNLASIPHRYLYESMGVRRGMWTISWFREQFGACVLEDARKGNLHREDIFNREAQNVPAGSDGLLTIHEWLAPWDKPYRKGSMIGFDARHTRAHMWRSILEGIAYTIKGHADGMCLDLGITVKRLVICGGGSNSDLFMQIFSDVFGIPAQRNVINNAASLGAAIDTAVAMEIYPDFDTAITQMVHPKDVFQPNMKNHQTYTDLIQNAYAIANLHLDEILKQTHPITG